MADEDDRAGGPGDPPSHTHRVAFPEALEVFFARLPELRTLVGPAHAPGVDRVGLQLQAALAARERGDLPTAMGTIARAMHDLADLVSDALPAEGPMMRAMAAQFEQAMRRGDLGEAQSAAEVMRVQSDSKILPRK